MSPRRIIPALLLCGALAAPAVAQSSASLQAALDLYASASYDDALVMLDAIARLVPGVVGDERSVENDSFSTGQLDFPHYTRPAVWRERAVPEVLLSGHHGAIDKWRQAMAAARTRQRRPDLTVGATARGKGKGEER